MERKLKELTECEFDLVVVGGGVYGAAATWDAALRGLSVALLERDDFGGATSFNSSKTIHGGLRYLQHADWRRMRESIRERSILMRIAPHLVHPRLFLAPTYSDLMRSRLALGAALFLNDLASFDRNRGVGPDKRLPRGRLISKHECLKLAPGIDADGLTGGALWHDAHMHNSDRMTLLFVLSASRAGAVVANHVRVNGFLRDANKVKGVVACDTLSQERIEIRSKVVLNACGPWVDDLLELLDGGRRPRLFLPSKALNLVTRAVGGDPDVALGVSSRGAVRDEDAVLGKGWRFLTIIPWRNVSIVGTLHASYRGAADGLEATEEDVDALLREVNRAYPGAQLKRADVRLVHRGLLPRAPGPESSNGVTLQKHYRIEDHRASEGLDGILSVVGVKYTTARGVAEKAVDSVFRHLGRTPPRCLTAETPLYGGDIENFDDYVARESRAEPRVRHLVCQHGSAYREVLRTVEAVHCGREPVMEGSPVVKGEIVHAARHEMAETLSSVVLRRTELGSAGHPGRRSLETSARIMAEVKGWSEARVEKEIEIVEDFYRKRT